MSFRALAIVCAVLVFASTGCDSEEEEPPTDECEYELATDVATDHLALYLPLDGDLKDHSGNCRHAESTLDLPFVDGKAGRAVRLNGLSDYFMIPYGEGSPIPASKYSVVMFVKLEEEVLQGELATFGCWEANYCLTHEWNFRSDGTWRTALAYPEGGGGDFSFEGVYSDWTMLVVNTPERRTGGAAPGDSQEFKDTNLSGSVGVAEFGQNVFFGSPDASPESNPDRMEGLIDEIRVYHKYLTKEELNELFEAYFGVPR